ncbi:MAG: hypothetical protein HC853_00545 [Anaerolineae bacterium]|nr:hypothetical protein [Anaerolineae bacterium]
MAAFLRRVNVAIGGDKLPLERKIRGAVREALGEISPVWVTAMKATPVWRKLENSNSMFLTARDMMYHQVLRSGCTPEQARAEAARRLLNGNAW